jgi:SET domain-containing protein
MQADIDHLYISASSIPHTGKGLFTSRPIDKGTTIIEYTGTITTWDAVKNESSNMYIYFVDEQHVINANKFPKSLARYANDAQGITKIKGIDNNSEFVNMDGRIFIRATKNIAADAEILVDYGAGYWETLHKNQLIKKRT